MGQVIESDVRSFRGRFSGEVITADDAQYDAARGVWNGDIDRRPALIARCTNAEEVAAAVRFGTERDLTISVRGGGHNFGGAAVAPDGLMIDLSPMDQVSVDPRARSVSCGGGAAWAAVDAATQEHGLATVGGTVSHTGVGGLTLGGGMGWLTPKFGLAIDNLVACQLVTADGRILQASESEVPDLFWALRGGGGNFGVVTRFDYRLHEVGPLVHVGLFFWGLEKGAEALRYCREYLMTVPDDMGVLIAGLNAPPMPGVPEQHHFQPGYALIVAGFGSAEEHGQAVQPVLRDCPPLFNLVSPMPYVALQKLLDDAAPWGIRAYEKGLTIAGLSDPVVDVMTEQFPQKNSPMSLMALFALQGAFTRVAETATAFGGSRQPQIAATIAAVCPTPELLEADRRWARSFWQELLPYGAQGSGGYVNFMVEYEEDRVRASYGAAKYDRLARIKAEYDPGNVFHLNMNIKPSLQHA
jgi:FAD/FMN-containing dehydrogenase